MPVYSIKEFAKLTGKEPKNIHVYCSRGKLIKNAHKQIDTTEDINHTFLEQNRIDQIEDAQIIEEKPKAQGQKKPKQQKIDYTKAEKETKEKGKKPVSNYQQLSEEKLHLEVEQKKLAIEKAELEIKNKRGELLDAAQALAIIGSYSENLKRELQQSTQTLIQDICSRYGIESAKAGAYKLKVTENINKASRFSIDELKKNLGNVG